MWQRRTYHDCAAELSQISERFRLAYTKQGPWSAAQRQAILHDTSVRGVEVLKILALSVRGDQDYGLIPRECPRVGALRTNVSIAEVDLISESYRPPYTNLDGFSPLSLRDALNKIAHASPAGNGFCANAETHDLILTGKLGDRRWMAVISLIDLCKVIASLPDAPIIGT